MKRSRNNNPPHWPVRLLEWYCDPFLVEDLVGDMDELYLKNLEENGRRSAKFKYISQTFSLLFSGALRARKKAKQHHYSTTDNIISMYKNYLLVAFRSLSSNKFFSIINIVGLAVGMSIGLLAVSALIDILTVDNFHPQADNIYRVVSNSKAYNEDSSYPDWASVPEPIAYELKQGYQGIEEVVRFNRSFIGSVQNPIEDIPMFGYYTDDNFFEVFGFTLAKGNPFTALKDPFSVVITQKTADKLFHGQNPMGEEIHMNGIGTFKVTGVLNQSPRSHLLFEALASYSTLPLVQRQDKLTDWLDIGAAYVYVQLSPESSIGGVQEGISKLQKMHYKEEQAGYATFNVQALNDIPMSYIYNNEIGISWGWPVMIVFFALAFLILLPACFNYANLSISRALNRSKEIGLRKVVGGQRTQIFTQFLLETSLIALISLGGAIILFTYAREEFLSMIVNGREAFDLELNFISVAGFIVFALAAGGIAGFAPALYFSRLSPLETLRTSSKPARLKKFNVRRVLTIGQFALSLFFIMGIAIILKQYKYALNYNFGFDKENVLDVQLKGVDPDQLAAEFNQIPEIQQISFSSHIAGTHRMGEAYVLLPEIQDSVWVRRMFVSDAYVKNLNLNMLSGRDFSDEALEDENYIIVNEKFLNQFQVENPVDALEQEYMIDGVPRRVIGVVEDFNIMALREEIAPFFFQVDKKKYAYANLKVASSDITGTMNKINAAWGKVAEDRKFEAAFMEEELDEAMISFRSMIKIYGGLGALSVVISCLGLLGMVVFTVQNKTKEVGVRKVMGASVAQLAYRLSIDYFKLLIYAAILATPIAYFMFDKLFLRIQHFRANIGFVEVAGSILVLFVIGLMTVLSQTLRAAKANPVKTLRYE